MADIIKNENFTADVLLNLLSETTDDYLYMWDIRNGTFYISDNAYDDLDISRLIEQDVVSVWSKIMVREDLELWLSDMQMIQEGSKDYHDMEYRVYNKSGRVIWVSCRGTVKKDRQDRPLFMIGRISNIGKQNKFDNVTGLMNRNQFEQDMNILVRQKDTANGVVVVLDIDNFKNINEKYGYGFGDRALNLLSNLISAMLPQGCQLYRLDGDEFVFLIKDGTKEAVWGIYENIQMFIGSHFAVEGRQILISLSAGACFFPDDGNTYQKLFRNAENAVEIAKMNGKNQLVFFSEEMYKQKLRNMELQESLHACVKDGFSQFELFYQPQVDAVTGVVTGAEALLRWHSPEHGEVFPSEFIPLLEESRLITQVGAWILEESVSQFRIWRRQVPDFAMSVNVSYIQLKENALLEYLKMRQWDDLPAGQLVLELTESCWVPNLQFLNQEFEELRAMGYGIAIDDFGTGYSSLSHLKELPANVLKVDRSFVTGIHKGSYEYIFLEYIIKLAHSIGLKVCVEGVETEEEFDIVKQTLPDYIQGYLFGRPVSASGFEKLYLK